MTFSNDIHVEVARLQKSIENHLGNGSTLIFDFIPDGNMVRLNLVTVNARHNQSFLFHQVAGTDRIDALTKMLEYVSLTKENDNSYTIQWMTKEDREIQTSYFRAKNIYEALDKLYFGRDINSMTVYSIVLNPVA